MPTGLPSEMQFSPAIAALIDFFWRNKRNGQLAKNIRDPELQQAFINAKRQKYIFPDYGELVGPARPEHHRKDGELTLRRKAELLLFGPFFWRGFWIAKLKSSAKYGWFARSENDYAPPEILHLRIEDKDPEGLPGMEPLVEQGEAGILMQTYSPLGEEQIQPLASLLVAQDIKAGDRPRPRSAYRVVFGDKDPFNCRFDNLCVRVGRPMMCKQCGDETTPWHSIEYRFAGERVRYCLICAPEILRRARARPVYS